MSPRNWLITGASSGMGRILTELVLAGGDRALAGVRNPSVLSDLQAKYPDTLFVSKLDVSIRSDITAIFSKAKNVFGNRLDVVFNGAGYSIIGEIEGTPEEQARSLFDVNFWGASNVARDAVEFLRDVNKPQGGRIITITSTTAITPFPTSSYYSASKAAIDSLLFAFAKELNPDWNIKSTVVEAGTFLTRFATKDHMTIVPPHPAYDSDKCFTKIIRDYLSKGLDQGNDPVLGMRVIYEYLSTLENPPLRFPLGADAVAAAKAASEEYKVLAEEHVDQKSLKI